MLPFVDQNVAYYSIEKLEAWDGPNNAKILKRLRVSVYECPERRAMRTIFPPIISPSSGRARFGGEKEP